jgi:hypothetical protein
MQDLYQTRMNNITTQTVRVFLIAETRTIVEYVFSPIDLRPYFVRASALNTAIARQRHFKLNDRSAFGFRFNRQISGESLCAARQTS